MNSRAQGFTLLEILLVVVIIGIMSVAGVNIVNSQSIERVILQQAQKFNDDLAFICEKAVFENRALGLEFIGNGYQVLWYEAPQWLTIDSQSAEQINDSISAEILLAGRVQDTQQQTHTDDRLPHIVCQADGSFNSFEVRLSVAANNDNSNDKLYYALSTQSPWQLNGSWHQP